MYSFIPQSVGEVHDSLVRDTLGNTPFERLFNYHKRITEKKELNKKSLVDRLITGNLISLPGEDGPKNCFENSFDVYLTAKKLYPESRPKLLNVNEGERGTHTCVFLLHEGEVYRVDPNYNIFEPSRIEENRIVSLNKDRSKMEKFLSLSELDDGLIENIGRSLRQGDIKLFLTGGGQEIYRDNSGYRPFSIFMKYENEKLISEMRFVDFSLVKNTAIRRIIDPERNTFSVQFLIYNYENWSCLVNEKLILGSDVASRVKGKGALLDNYLTFEELKKDNLFDQVCHFYNYHGFIRFLSQKRHKSVDSTHILSKKQIQKLVDNEFKDLDKPWIKYSRGISEKFFERCLEYLYIGPSFFMAHKFRNLSYQQGQKLTWEDLRKSRANKEGKLITSRGILNLFTKEMAGIIKKERKITRQCEDKVVQLMQRQR